MNQVFVNIAVEDDLSESVLRRILSYSGQKYVVRACYCRGGFGYLEKNIRGFNLAAKGIPFFVLTDLDRIECAPDLIKEWLPTSKHPNLLIRIAVREVEAWLLASRKMFSKYLGTLEQSIPDDVENIADPKQFIISLSKKSKYRHIREAIAPILKTGAIQGPDYNAKLINFVNNYWDIKEAMIHSASLKRTVKRVSAFKPYVDKIKTGK